jgi:hypothetical protein
MSTWLILWESREFWMGSEVLEAGKADFVEFTRGREPF